MLFGAHLSTKGGLFTVFDRADEVGADAIQIFTKNKGAWAATPLTDADLALFRKRARALPARTLVAHAAYLLNIASPDEALRLRSAEALRIELERCEALGIPYLVLHPGSHMGSGEEEGLRRAAACLDEVHRATRGFRARVLLETASGQGSAICHRLESLASLLDLVKRPELLGACIDTCHLFAAGYELRTEEGYEATMESLERLVGMERVLCVHANDSKRELGSRVDRHEHIGRGCLGRESFRRIVNDPRFEGVPLILELSPENEMNRVNLRALRRLVRRAPGKARPRGRSPAGGSGRTSRP